MATDKPLEQLRIEYEEAAQAYLRSLPLEHFMESVTQSTQRKITVESLDLVHARRPEIQHFSELLVQYSLEPEERIRQVVPDNMVVVWKKPIDANGSYDLAFQPVGPCWVLEYVSKSNKRKDYEDNMQKYEHELKVPYYLRFYAEGQELTLFHLAKRKYRSVKPNERDRYAIPELDLEMALLDDWVRYWYKGELLPLPADLQRNLEKARRQLRAMTRRAKQQARRAEAAEEEVRRLRAELERLRAPD
jgi:Uma2 family endonuclease